MLINVFSIRSYNLKETDRPEREIIAIKNGFLHALYTKIQKSFI